MSKWQTVRLGDVATYINGYAFKPSDWSDSGLPIIRIQNLTGNDYETNYYSGSYDAKYEIINGDILISWSASLGVYEWKRGKALLNQHIFKVVFDKLNVDKSYFVHTVSYLLDDMLKETHGSTMKHITKPRFDNTPFPYPTIEEQHQIAATLDKVTHTIDLCNAILEKLDILVKSRFVEMFGEPVHNTKNLDTKQGIDIFKLSNGKAVPEEKRMDSGIPAYGGNGISWYTDEVLFDKDTLVIGRVGFQSGNVHYAQAPLWITDNAMYISDLIDQSYDLTFLCALMEHIDFTRYQDAGDLKKITQKPFMNMSFIAPPLDMQKEYVSFVKQIDKSKVAVQKALDEAQLLFDSLMQEYFG